MAPIMQTPNFLSIHLEIRDLIYTIYLTSPDQLPPPSVTRAHRISRGTHQNSGQWFWEQDDDERFFNENCTHYPDPSITPAMPASLSLLLCNRQMHAEVSSIIAFLTDHTKELQYEIDCEIVDEMKLYPTWRHIPARFVDAPIPCLYVTFRISGQFDDDDGRRSGWAHRAGGPGQMMWSVMALFNRFLMVGPNFIRRKVEIEVPPPSTTATVYTSQASRGESKLKFLLNKLFKGSSQIDNRSSVPGVPDITVKTSESGAPQIQGFPGNEIRIERLVLDFAPSSLPRDELGARRDVAGEMIDPAQVAAFMKTKLDFLFDNTVWTSTVQSGRFIASRVNSVHLLCCGQDLAMWDLAGKGVLH